jgi:hypothetical protein
MRAALRSVAILRASEVLREAIFPQKKYSVVTVGCIMHRPKGAAVPVVRRPGAEFILPAVPRDVMHVVDRRDELLDRLLARVRPPARCGRPLIGGKRMLRRSDRK